MIHTFGRVPLFVYLIHLYVAHGAAVLVGLATGVPARLYFGHGNDAALVAAGAGVGLGGVYLAWAAIVLALWPLATWYARLQGAPARLVARLSVIDLLLRPLHRQRAGGLAGRHDLDAVDVDVARQGRSPTTPSRRCPRPGSIRRPRRAWRRPILVAGEADLGELGAAAEARLDVGDAHEGADEIGLQVQRELLHEGFGAAVDVAAGVGVGTGDRGRG